MPHIIQQIVIFQKAIIQNDEGLILALRRSKNDKHRPGAWDLPGGGLEKGEDIDAALQREVREETSLEINQFRPIYAQTVHQMFQKGVDVHFICWCVDSWTGTVKLSAEHQAYRWVTLDEFNRLPTWDEEGFLKKGAQVALRHL